MTIPHRLVVPFLALALLAGCAPSRGPSAAELVLRHGRIYTMTGPGARVAALAIADGRILFAGSDADAARYVGDDTRVVDLGGRTVLPGFEDAHVHMLDAGLEQRDCQIVDLSTPQQVFARVESFARSHPELAWIRGAGWELPVFPHANPRKEWLDKLVPDRPAYIEAADSHSAWVNSRALAAAHITKDTPDPSGGRIEHDPKTGEPSGTLRESAMELVARLLPPHTAAERRAALLDSLAQVHRLGITAALEANCDEDNLATFRDLDRMGRLGLRVRAAQSTKPEAGPAQVPAIVRRRTTYATANVVPATAKIFVDGVMESHTAAMLAPYLDPKTGKPTGQSGKPFWQPDVLDATVVALDAAGIQVHFHAIGDRAVRLALDAIEAARRANGDHDLRHTIAHLEGIDRADIPRFRALGAVADFQPFWCYRDDYITTLTEPVLGPARSSRLYPMGEIARTGAVLACGSDWPVSSVNPLDGIQVAVTRRPVDAAPGMPWLPDERLDRYTAVAGYTRAAAYTMHRERQQGTLEAGKAADLVVLDGDVFTVPATSIHKLHPLLTMVAGRAVYRDPKAPGLGGVTAW